MDALLPAHRSEQARYFALLAALVLAGSLALAYVRVPGTACYFRLLFHLPCPGCGLTRSLESLWHGDLCSSFRYHPLGIPIFALCIAATIRGARRGVRRPVRVPGLSLRNVVLLFVAVWLVRLASVAAGSRFFLW